MKFVALLVVSAAMGTGPAMAYCSQPSAPYSRPSAPTVPYCVNTWDNSHTCDDWQIDSYNQSLRMYRSEVEDYVRALQRYVDEAVEYAQCEIRELE